VRSRLKTSAGLAILAIVTLVQSTAPASAAAAYERQSPYTSYGSYRCADDATTVDQEEIIGYDTVWGVARLRRSHRCGTMWATVTYGGNLDASEYGNAHVRDDANLDYTCDTPGGNGHVTTGQSSCYTPMTVYTDIYVNWAEGYHYVHNGAAWSMVGFGGTAAH
jgi:hypothetical protein